MDGLTLTVDGAMPRFGTESRGVTAALENLRPPGAPEARLVQLVLELDGSDSLPHLYYCLSLLAARGQLRYRFQADGDVLAEATPMTGGFLPTPDLSDSARFQLSRFAFVRRRGEQLVLEAAPARFRFVLVDPRSLILTAALVTPRTVQGLAGVTGLDPAVIEPLLGTLLGARMVSEVAETGELAEDRDESLRHWEFHDLTFHSRSRLGLHDDAIGSTFGHADRVGPLPAVKARMSDDIAHLPEPPATSGLRTMSLADALVRRRSIRHHGGRAIGVEALGEFLFYTAKATALGGIAPGDPQSYEVTRRASPSGGACHSLELYVVVHRCDGLPRGIYHYQPLEHVVCRLPSLEALVDALLRDARVATGAVESPQLLIVVTSRFRRLSWKYSGIAYATGLKDLGALMQTMYLVATAMDLAPCALGAGDSTLFSRAVGTPWAEESSIGEFMLGTCPRMDWGYGGFV